jgi:HAD superfamily hydrolase (TIGR01484 family)
MMSWREGSLLLSFPAMRPLALLSADEARSLEGLLLDLDDTVLDHGRLTPSAYASLARAAASGLRVVVVTGRPVGWGEVLARMWPVDGVVSENGAVASRRVGGRVELLDRADADERGRRRRELGQIWAAVRGEFPDAVLSDDSAMRRTDLAIDVGEGRQVAPDQVAAMARLGRSLGARTTLSSVHLHLSLDEDDKASGAMWFLRELCDADPTRALRRYAFAGDSGNDAACFAAFRTTIGVANVAPHARRMSVPPRYIAQGARGAGFSEIVETLLALRCRPA